MFEKTEEECLECKGAGIREKSVFIDPDFSKYETCPLCDGKGYLIRWVMK